MTCTTIRELLFRAQTLWPQQEVYSTKEEERYHSITLEETAERVRNLGNGLLLKGVKQGDRIGILAENRNEWPLVYLAVTSIGAIILPISILWEPEELIKLGNTGKVSLIFTSATYFNKVAGLVGRVPWLRRVVCFDQISDGGEYLPFYQLLAEGLKGLEEGQNLFDGINIQSTDIAEILFVNCSLGVKLSHQALLANVEGLFQTMQLQTKENRRALMLLPYSHLYPTVFGILMPLLAQWTTVTAATARMDHILRMIKETEPHYIFLVPLLLDRFYTRLAGRLHKGEKTLVMLGFKDVEWIFTAGAKCPEELLEKVTALGFLVLEGYGVSEMAPFLTVNTPSKHCLGSAGIPLCNVELKIQQMETTGYGEVTAKGPNMMSGYDLLPQVTEGVEKKQGKTVMDELGWLHTGDIGRLDEEGFLHITGRSRNILVNKGGTNIYPSEIEGVLLKKPLIQDVLIVARWEKTTGEYPFAYIQVNQDTTLTPTAQKEQIHLSLTALAGQIAAYKIPRSFEIVPDITPYRTQREKNLLFTSLYKEFAN